MWSSLGADLHCRKLRLDLRIHLQAFATKTSPLLWASSQQKKKKSNEWIINLNILSDRMWKSCVSLQGEQTFWEFGGCSKFHSLTNREAVINKDNKQDVQPHRLLDFHWLLREPAPLVQKLVWLHKRKKFQIHTQQIFAWKSKEWIRFWSHFIAETELKMPAAHPVRNYVCLQILNSHILNQLCDNVWNDTFKASLSVSLGQINVTMRCRSLIVRHHPKMKIFKSTVENFSRSVPKTQISMLRANHSETDARVGRDLEQSVCPPPCGRTRNCGPVASHWANTDWRRWGWNGEGEMGVAAGYCDIIMESQKTTIIPSVLLLLSYLSVCLSLSLSFSPSLFWCI